MDYMLMLKNKDVVRNEEFSTIEEALKTSEKYLASGWVINLWVRHSTIKLGGVVLEKSEVQKKAEEVVLPPVVEPLPPIEEEPVKELDEFKPE